MRLKRHHIYALILSCLLLCSAVSLLFLNQWLSNAVQAKVEVRQVHTISLPPPPPPPVQQQTQTPVQTVTLAVAGQGAALNLTLVPQVKVDIVTPEPVLLTQPPTDWQAELDIDWQAFGLDQLDGLPQLLTPIKAQFPNSLVRQGILHVVVKLDVFIDEQGQVSLIAITDNPHPELVSSIHKLVKTSRFSVPKKNGQAVKARFIWPVEFKK
ncbi:energy transducer TonB [Pseudoalteromonas tunicata]|uniref:energy transducer TonB n=1 Tax=Pseudoalteromonas tunicata TaxID=314281 RepID=UPI00273E520A|nr:energy transducer TonB [Pseudoalteromonas tunicata]MDP5212228.1 energy transducer TonB [Pseudoalteromonas tunicata]